MIVLTAYGDVPTAVAALQAGAAHYLTKPVNFDEVAHVVEKTIAAGALAQENQSLRRAVQHLGGEPGLLGGAAATERLRGLIAKVAPGETTVLVRGESGAGKEVVARAIHAAERSSRPAVPRRQLRGHRRDPARERAVRLPQGRLHRRRRRPRGAVRGRRRAARVFLDEIGEAGPAVQAKLLRVLESRTINRVGDPRERTVAARVVAATTARSSRRVREDLYYRLRGLPDRRAAAARTRGRHRGRSRSTSSSASAGANARCPRRPCAACARTPGPATSASCAT